MSFIEELKRRNVFRVGLAYVLVAWVTLQGADFVLDLIGAPDWVIRALAVTVAIGLPVALIFAWAFELTPEGVVRTEAVSEDQSIATETGRKLDFALAFAILALVVVIIWQQSSRPVTPVPVAATEQAVEIEAASGPLDASVAVLPFTDMSPEGDQEYFSDGLTEEILNLLVRADAIEVVSRTSSFQFKNSNLGIPEIATELNVRHIVEGSVRRQGNSLIVTKISQALD